ncbi:MAG: hypothetical protein NTV97_00530 [Alphaproteobacteria bacterium]|nr:hypothetical protein [Alphaproteobacteria bacterium]
MNAKTAAIDALVLAALQGGGPKATYVVANIVNAQRRPRLTTAFVRRSLIRLELAGAVERAPTSYAVMHVWRATAAAETS